MIDFEAYKKQQEIRAQERWEIGAYLHNALNCSILVATLADKSTPNRMPKFPERPNFDQNNEDFGGMSEERLKAERTKAYYAFKIWADNLKSVEKGNNK